MKTGILGLGQWLPDTKRLNDAWPDGFADAHAARIAGDFGAIQAKKEGDAIDQIVAKYAAAEGHDPFLGIRQRCVAHPKMTSREAEIHAALAALEDAKVDARDVDVVLSSTAVPDRITPPTAPAVAHAIGAANAWAVGLDAVCASVVVGLEMASALVESGRARTVLLTQSHLMTRAFPMMHPESPNVGDAATAVVVGATERGGIRAICVRSNGAYADAVVWRRPKEADTPWWEPGGAFSMGSCDSARARELMQDTVRVGANALREVCDVARVPVDSVDVLASVHPRRWVPRAIAEACGLPPERAVTTADELAHLGTCGVVTNLIAARSKGQLERGRLVALYGQGAGFTRAAALVEWG